MLTKTKHQLRQVYKGWQLGLVRLPECADTYFRGEKNGKVLTSLNYTNLLYLIDLEESK